MRVHALLALPLLIASSSAWADCDHSAPRRLTANAAGATRVVITAKAGTLRVSGRPGADVTASGTACTSDRDFLSQINLVARRDGSDLLIEAIIPERVMVFSWHEARLDFEVGVPENLPVEIRDGSGSARIEDVASVEVVDGSGEVEIRGVRGNVEVTDGSGQISIRDVGGNVRISDGSGSIEVSHVGGSVVVRVDGSGSIDVDDVKGDFIIERDGSGGVDFERIGGKVSIPRD
jgi:hypothetical protein